MKPVYSTVSFFIAALGVSALLLGACQSLPSDDAEAKVQIEAAMHNYSERILHMDMAAIATSFSPDGEMIGGADAPAIRGRAAIQAHLERFKDFHVELQEDITDAISINGDSAQLLGRYHQRVTLPDGKRVEVRGRYIVDWLKLGGRWMMQRMRTIPSS